MCAAHPYRPTAPGHVPGACLSLGRLLVAAARAALWAARPGRPRRRAPARGRSRCMRAAGRRPRPALLRLSGRPPRGRRSRRLARCPSSAARARRRSGAAAPRLPAPAGAGVLALAPLRWAAGCAAACPSGRPARRLGSLIGRPPSAPGSLLGCGRSGGAPQPRGRVLGLGPLAAAPPAGPLAPPGAALGGRVPGPAGSGVGRAAARRPAARGRDESRPLLAGIKKNARIRKVVQRIALPSGRTVRYTENARRSH